MAPMPICAVLLQLAQEPALYVPKWSESILSEVAHALSKPSFNLSKEQIDRRLNYMRNHFEEALVTDYEVLIPAMGCHQGDRHVLAAAVRCEADAIVTNNTRHFPDEALRPFGIERLTADDFLLQQYHLDSFLVKQKLEDLNRIRGWNQPEFLKRLNVIAPKFTKLIA